MTAWERMHARKKELGFTVMIFRNNFLFENYKHGVQLEVPRTSKVMTDDEADFIIEALEQVMELNPEVVNRFPRNFRY